MIQLSLLLTLGLVLFFFSILLLYQLVQGAPYVPSGEESVKNMVMLAKVVPGEKMIDLGSGDGRIVIAFAKAGAEAHGYENNPFLIWWSRKKIKQAGLSDTAFIHAQSMWSVDFSEFSIVTVFGITHMMGRLERRLNKQLKPGARVLSNAFRLPHWELAEKSGSVLMFVKK